MDKLKIRFTKPPGAINSLSAQQVVVDKFEDWESIPDPMPATKMVPEWFKQTKPLGGPIDTMPTIKKIIAHFQSPLNKGTKKPKIKLVHEYPTGASFN